MNDPDDRREELREKLEKSRQSLTVQPVPETDPPEGIVALAMEYPFAAIAGGLAIGVLAGTLLPRGVGRSFARGAVSAVALAGKVGREYGMQALETAGEVGRDGRLKLAELGSAAARSTEVQSRKGRELGFKLVGEAIKFASTLRH